MSPKFNKFNPNVAKKLTNPRFWLIGIYIIEIIAIDNAPDINPIIIPSTINGHLIKAFVAPTYFIIEISFLLAYTVSFIVFEIINTLTIINAIIII